MKKLFCIVITIAMVFGLVACSGETSETTTDGSSTSSTSAVATDTSTGEVVMTDAGTPRTETLVVTMASGRWTGEMKFNPYISSSVWQGNGFRALIWEHLWQVDESTGEMICTLAKDFAKPVDDTYTKFEVKLRQGVKWSDGVDFTADDVVYTSELLLNTPEMTSSGAFSAAIKSITKIDDYTVLIETISPETRIEQILGVIAGDNLWFRILPKHIFENVDVLTYEYDECVGTGPYKLVKYDDNGNYFLFEKRQDVECSAQTMVYGEPVPKYVLFECFGEADTTIMATVNNQLDCYNNCSMESLEYILEQNSEAREWFDSFPYGNIGTAPLGILYNCAVEPFDKVDVRWALVLSLDVKDLIMSYNGGASIADPLAAPANKAMAEKYIDPLTEWLESFTLSDGYQPFDNSYAENIAATLTQQGIEGLPSDKEALVDMFGVGWWKYDTTKAEKILLAEGFTRDSNGMWLKSDGEPWKITITINQSVQEYERLAYAITAAWNDFGIDAVVNSLDYTNFQADLSQGSSDCYIMWLNQSGVIDLTGQIKTWKSDGIAPVGENTPIGFLSGASARWASDEIDAIINELNGITADNPRSDELIEEYLKVMVENMPYAVVVTQSSVHPVTTHYWTGFPNSENPYNGTCWWFASFTKVLANITATGNQ